MSNYQIYINPHCGNCAPAIARMRAAVTAMGHPAPDVVNVLDDVDGAVRLRITRVPALVRDGQVLVQGAAGHRALQRAIRQEKA